MSERIDDTSDEVLGRRLAAELTRHTAPARLRVTIVEAATPRSRRPVWLMPMLSAAATAMILVLAVMPVLPRIVPADPVQRYVRAVVSEHSRAIMWGARHGEVLPTALPWLTQESGIALSRVFVGDERVRIAGFDCEAVVLTPKDELRYGYKLWADVKTGMLPYANYFWPLPNGPEILTNGLPNGIAFATSNPASKIREDFGLTRFDVTLSTKDTFSANFIGDNGEKITLSPSPATTAPEMGLYCHLP
jgi:hypothetical protein